MGSNSRDGGGRALLNSVERFISDPEWIMGQVERYKTAAGGPPDEGADTWRRQVAEKIIQHYCSSAAVSGGITSLPSLVPGAGMLISVTAGALMDMAALLKLEVELALALSYLYGFDIRDEEERQVAFLLASVSTYESETGSNLLDDMIRTEGTALWNYASREVARVLAVVLGRLAARVMSRGPLRAVPMVGVIAGATMNMILTARVGNRICEELEQRRAARKSQMDSDQEDVVDGRTDE